MGIEKDKSPWSRGDEMERKLGRKTFQQLRRERALKQGQDDFLGAIKGVVDSGSLEPNFEFEHFRLYLEEDFGGTFSKTYEVTPEGYVIDRAWKPQEPDLLTHARASVRKGDERHATVEDLRVAAQRASEKFPQIRFTFDESSDRGKITYTATVLDEE